MCQRMVNVLTGDLKLAYTVSTTVGGNIRTELELESTVV